MLRFDTSFHRLFDLLCILILCLHLRRCLGKKQEDCAKEIFHLVHWRISMADVKE